MPALVTGGAGFIGSHLVDRLVEQGEDVVVVDDFSTGKSSNLPAGIQIGKGSITNFTGIDRVFEAYNFNRVFHLAAQIDVRKSVAAPAHDADVNVTGTVSILQAIQRHGTDSFVFTSTGGAIYGDGGPFTETYQAAPESPYALSKHCAEQYINFYGDGTILRLANVYGPRQDPHGEAGVVAIFNGQDEPVTVYGDGSQTRDFIHVSDVVDAILAAEGHSGTFNIGTGVETSVLELAELMGKTVKYEPARDGEIQRSFLDPRLAANTFGWEARTSLMAGIDGLTGGGKEW